ncbi:hypothetical protein LEM8419_02257 [Neolewinella maritima]|uniref:M23ase beta-sheet core domain-containing protein n=1 Tax=Neolewinella maritima TaxID=1383882 RepID=A0ABN8F9D2_9BACT|nr:M23 family metallopeptidase [Neolewinella maritima]CAH1001356.1 hypothetical protein LEM8419_02257 [Neolewinella maritima]
MIRLICLGLFLLYSLGVSAQYTPPLRGPLLVTGTFGELRSDHFHGGLDFRAAVGTPVYAVQEGYVSRIRVSGGGYGQAVYIDHPDGKRSVYGHLEVLAPAYRDTIRALQYAGESFEIDLRPDSLAFPVRQGQQIGGVGNRGFSFGPHLHFEIRESATDAPLNPLSLGFAVPDTRSPQLRKLRVYSLDARDHPVAETEYDLLDGSLPDTVRVSHDRVGLGFQAFDRQNAMPNRNGIYAAALHINERKTFSFVYDRIAYEDTEYLNALTDYSAWKQRSSWYYLLYARTPDAVFWRDTTQSLLTEDGIQELLPGEPVTVTVSVRDFAGNTSHKEFILLYTPDTAAPIALRAPPPYTYDLPAGEPSVIDTGGMRLELPAQALYDDLYFAYTRLRDTSTNYLSDAHRLHDVYTPLHGRARLSLSPREPVPVELQQRVYLARCGKDGTYRSVGGAWEGEQLVSSIGSFGTYALLLDTVPPTVRIERFRTDLRRAAGFSLLLEEAAGGTLSYRGTVDGTWVLLEYDAKSGRLSHTFEPGEIAAGQHTFLLSVTDARGNERTFTRGFRR